MGYSSVGVVGVGATPEELGITQGEFCAMYVVRADGRCQDSSGMHPLQWYNNTTGKCELPPPVSCNVNAPNLPVAAPAPRPAPRPPAPRPAPPPAPTEAAPAPAAKKAGLLPGVPNLLLGAGVATLGLVFLAQRKKKKKAGGVAR